MDEGAIFDKHIRVDDNVDEGAVFAAHARFVIVDGFAICQPVKDRLHGRRVFMKFRHMMAHIFPGGISEQIQFGLICLEDATIGAGPMHANRGVLKKIGEFLLAAAQLFIGLAARIAFPDFAQGPAHGGAKPVQLALRT